MQTPLTMNPALTLRVRTSGGVWTRREALELGHRDIDLRGWLRSGEIRSACRGVYYLPSTDSDLPTRNATDLRRRSRAVLRVLPDDVVLSHGTALTVHGLPRLEAVSPRARIDVTPTGPRAWSARPEVFMHRPVAGLRRTDVDGLRVATAADAVIQYAAGAGAEAGVVAGDAALRDRIVTKSELAAAAARLRHRPGAGHLPVVLAQVDERSESPGESRTRLICRLAGVEVIPQVEIRDERARFVARVDLLVEGSRVVIEFDGLDKYRGPDHEDALVREKRREHELHRLGYVVVRVTWGDLRDPAGVVERIRVAVARSGSLSAPTPTGLAVL